MKNIIVIKASGKIQILQYTGIESVSFFTREAEILIAIRDTFNKENDLR